RFCSPSVCPSGVVGPECSLSEPCKPGYSCIGGNCCRDLAPPPVCPSGVVGPECSLSEPCKPGYSCIGGNCCRDPVCPDNEQSAGSCVTIMGMPRCAHGYECIGGFCCPHPCQFGFTGQTCSNENQECPSGSTCNASGKCCKQEQNRCPFFIPPIDSSVCSTTSPPECSTDRDCTQGRACCSGPCGNRLCI
ncbi:hypothetical protein MAR_026439, partial [Mya arenaria]